MNRIHTCAALSAITLLAPALFAQDLTGNWQGTLTPPNGKDLRIVMKVSNGAGSALKAVMYSIDQDGTGFPASSVTVQSGAVKIAIAGLGATYEGKLNTDANAMTGTWTQGPNPLPLNLTLATPATIWVIPEPPPPPTRMTANADPSFEVATIKPTPPDFQGKGINVDGRNFTTKNTSLVDLLTFCYGLHPRQLAGLPAWAESDKFDIAAIPDKPGAPSDAQWKLMVQKLIADRFHFTFHREKRELNIYAITLAKTGSKLTPSAGDPDGLPGLGFRGRGNMVVRNANMSDFANLLQSAVFDRPVVDQTDLKGRFDFTLLWLPDETQFAGRGGGGVPQDAENRPNVYTAFQEQLGLKLEATKGQADVLVVDRVEKASAN